MACDTQNVFCSFPGTSKRVLFLSWRAGGQHGTCLGTWPPCRRVAGGLGDWQAGKLAPGDVLALPAAPETLPTPSQCRLRENKRTAMILSKYTTKHSTDGFSDENKP